MNTSTAVRTVQEQSHLSQQEQIRAIIESALPSRDAHSVLSINTFYSARSQLEEERKTLKLAQEKLRNALPVGSTEHESIAIEVLGDYFNPETLAASSLEFSSEGSFESTNTSVHDASIAVLALGDSSHPKSRLYHINSSAR
jgi:hypothetical protein